MEEKRRPRRFYAFTDSVNDPGRENPRLRLSAQFDVVDAEMFDSLGDGTLKGIQPISGAGFGIIRLLTTHGRLDAMDTKAPEETDWMEIELERREGNPRAWFAPADAGLVPQPGVNAPRITSLESDAGAAAIARLNAFCRTPKARRIEAREVLDRMAFAKRRNLTITALDVGQASCTAFSEGRRDIGYFDAGWPVAFNRHSSPPNFSRIYPDEGFVLLSHWDFDHFALAIGNPSLMTLDWYAPEQKVGPYTAQFQKLLGSRLHFISGDAITQGLLLKKGLGTNPKDRNASGYVLRFERNDEAVLLTGDADYLHIPADMKDETTALTTPHHGGKGSQPPKPAWCRLPTAVASYGLPNNYKHPDANQLAAHGTRGWHVKHTAAHGKNPRIPRTGHRLFPLNQALAAPAKKKSLATVS